MVIRGGGDLATGVAARLHRCGFHVLVIEISHPLAVRRLVSLAEAVYAGQVEIEDLQGRLVHQPSQVYEVFKRGQIPLLVDPTASILEQISPVSVVDARMRKKPPESPANLTDFTIGLGPGFIVGEDCHAIVETNRGHQMGRVLWEGSAEEDTGVPEPVTGYDVERVLRAPSYGKLLGRVPLGSIVLQGIVLAEVDQTPLLAPFYGALRGLIHDGITVHKGMKVGDLDPRGDPLICNQISDKALAVGGGVLEALLSQSEIRRQLSE